MGKEHQAGVILATRHTLELMDAQANTNGSAWNPLVRNYDFMLSSRDSTINPRIRIASSA